LKLFKSAKMFQSKVLKGTRLSLLEKEGAYPQKIKQK